MNQEHTHTLPARAATLERAAALVGGYAELAARQVSQRELGYWIEKISTPPHTVFFNAIDIIIENAGALRAQSG
jgi:hypothetical protein